MDDGKLANSFASSRQHGGGGGDKPRNRLNKNVHSADFSPYQQYDGRNYRERPSPYGFEAAAAAFHAVNAENHPGKGFSQRNVQQPLQQSYGAHLKREKDRGRGLYGGDVRGSFDIKQCIGFMKFEWSKVMNLMEEDANAVVWYQTDNLRQDSGSLN